MGRVCLRHAVFNLILFSWPERAPVAGGYGVEQRSKLRHGGRGSLCPRMCAAASRASSGLKDGTAVR